MLLLPVSLVAYREPARKSSIGPGTEPVTYLLRRRSSGVKLVPAKVDADFLSFVFKCVFLGLYWREYDS